MKITILSFSNRNYKNGKKIMRLILKEKLSNLLTIYDDIVENIIIIDYFISF
jgi:hypothetical protein